MRGYWKSVGDGWELARRVRTESEFEQASQDLARLKEAYGRGVKPNRGLVEVLIRRDRQIVGKVAAAVRGMGMQTVENRRNALRHLLRGMKLGRLYYDATRAIPRRAMPGGEPKRRDREQGGEKPCSQTCAE